MQRPTSSRRFPNDNNPLVTPNMDNALGKEVERRMFGRTQSTRNHKQNLESGRDPIAQRTHEYLASNWRPSTRRCCQFNMDTLNKPSKDEYLQNRAVGEYNDLLRERKDDINWRSSSKRTEYYYQKPQIDAFLDVKRGRKMVADERSQKNPILQENIKVLEQRIRKAPEISDSYKDQNDKRYLRENNKPRPERVNYEDNYVKRNRKEAQSFSVRGCFQEIRKKHLGTEAKGILGYEAGPSFRKDNIANKPNQVDANQLANSRVNRKPLKSSDLKVFDGPKVTRNKYIAF